MLVLSRRFQGDFSLHDIMNWILRPVVNNPEMGLTIWSTESHFIQPLGGPKNGYARRVGVRCGGRRSRAHGYSKIL